MKLRVGSGEGREKGAPEMGLCEQRQRCSAQSTGGGAGEEETRGQMRGRVVLWSLKTRGQRPVQCCPYLQLFVALQTSPQGRNTWA